MEEKRRYVWEEDIRVTNKKAKKYRTRENNVQRLQEIADEIAKMERIIELTEKAMEARVLERVLHFYGISDDEVEDGEIARIHFHDGRVDFIFNVYGMASDEQTRFEQKMKKRGTSELLQKFYQHLLEAKEEQVQILNDLAKYEVVVYVENEDEYEEDDDDEW